MACLKLSVIFSEPKTLLVWLKNFGQVKVFRTRLKDQLRHYACHLPGYRQPGSFDRGAFTEQQGRHWQFEQYPRAVKQVYNIERFRVRSKGAIKNHVFAAICGFVQLQKLSFAEAINNYYGMQRDLFKEVDASCMGSFMPVLAHLNPESHPLVNA